MVYVSRDSLVRQSSVGSDLLSRPVDGRATATVIAIDMANRLGKLGGAEVDNFSASGDGPGYDPGPFLFPALLFIATGLLTDHRTPPNRWRAQAAPLRLNELDMQPRQARISEGPSRTACIERHDGMNDFQAFLRLVGHRLDSALPLRVAGSCSCTLPPKPLGNIRSGSKAAAATSHLKSPNRKAPALRGFPECIL